jgi:CspA family cold shock protein
LSIVSWLNQQSAPASEDEGAAATARVKWFSVAKGFGFVTPEDGSADAFLHISVLNRAGLQDLADGAVVQCRLAPGAKGTQVTHLLGVTAAPPPGTDADAASASTLEIAGTVKWFKVDKGFGFVVADDASKDVFVHKSVLRRCGFSQLETGQRVLLKVQEATKGREATWISPL